MPTRKRDLTGRRFDPDRKYHPRQRDADGNLVREMHSYLAANGSSVAIALMREYKAGCLIRETYVVNGRLVSRKSYENARSNFASMPEPNTAIEDSNAKLLRMMATKRRDRQAAAKTHVRDPKRGRELDSFCRKLIAEGESANARSWIKQRKHTLGEMDAPASRRLVARLVKLGCVAITACKIDQYPDGQANAGHVVVELPKDIATRGKILRALDRLAEQQGYTGDPDDGQRYCYVKLD